MQRLSRVTRVRVWSSIIRDVIPHDIILQL